VTGDMTGGPGSDDDEPLVCSADVSPGGFTLPLDRQNGVLAMHNNPVSRLCLLSVLTVATMGFVLAGTAAEFSVGDKVRCERAGLSGDCEVTEVMRNGWYKVKFLDGKMGGRSIPIPPQYLKPIAGTEASKRRGSPGAAGQPVREWADSTGKFKVQAKFVSEVNGSVTLKRSDDREIAIPLARLSDEDKAYILELQANMAASPFHVVDESAGPAGSVNPPKVIQVDLAAAREVSPAPTNVEWKFDAPVPADFTYPESYPPVSYQRTGDKYETVATSVPSQRVLLTFSRRDKERYPDENLQIVCRYVLADLAGGKSRSFDVGPLDSTMQALALNDEGNRAVLRRSVWGFGKSDRLEHWELTEKGATRLLQWVPYPKSRGANRDVKWVRHLAGDRLVTVSGGGVLVVWDVTTATPTYQFRIKGGSTPGISPDRRYICYSRGDDVGVLDVERGEVVAAQSAGSSLTWPNLRFNPTGTKVACLDHTRLKVWDFPTGELLVDMPKRGLPHGGFRFISDNHLLISGQALFDIQNQLVIWSYQGAGAAEEYGEFTCFVANSRGSDTGLVLLERLPQPEVKETLAKAMEDPDFWVLTKGTQVRLDLSGLEDGRQREVVEASLTRKLEEQGCRVGDGGTIDLVASLKESEKKKQVSYGRAFGPFSRGAVPFNVREFISKLSFVYQGDTAWEQAGTNIPRSFSLKDGEAITTAIKRFEKPNYDWFTKVELPLVLRKPTGQSTLGTTQVTTAGLR